MSSIEDEGKKRDRSVKLYQLIYDRRIADAIGLEIRKLLEQGVNINYQDKNRNKKTAIHLAVDKCDLICVKFLLQFKPSLEVKDGDGKTPIEVAESRGDQNVLDALMNSTVDVVNKSNVEVIDFRRITLQKVEAIKSRSTFKVLKLINCPSVNEVWNKLDDSNYAKTLNESSHLFFVAIETRKSKIQNDHELMQKVLNLRRPMIVQLSSPNSKLTKIYFKDDKKDFVEITGTPQMTQDEFNEAVDSERNLKLLVAALRSNLFGHFTGNLLETKLNINENRSGAVKQFVKSNALCHRFLKLFDESQPQIDTIVATLSFKGDQSLLALLDLPFQPKDEKLKLNDYQQDILAIIDSSGCNLLMMAARNRNFDAVKLLLRCGCDFNHSDNVENRASDICWDVKAFNCLAELIEAGSPYPNNFSIEEIDESSEAHERIKTIIEAVDSFHEHIKQGENEEVKKFIASFPHIKHAFDTNNKCALTAALQSKEVDIYSLLMSKGFEPGADDEYCTAFLKIKFKNKIRNSHRKYFKEAFDDHYLKRLLKMSRLSFGSKDRAKCSTIIRKMFDELNEIYEVIPILKICSLSDQLRIVFDFNCESVANMDPTSPKLSGVVYHRDGFIYVGAKNHEKELCKVIGYLIHELTHYAMKMTYENNLKPYDDIENKKRFGEIAIETKKICDKNPSTDSIVSTVFTLYEKKEWHHELIVRVPELLAHHKTNPQALEAAERNTPELFHFYREKTSKDVERESKIRLQKYLIRKINNQTGIARKIENLNVKLKNIKENFEFDLMPSVCIVTSNAPQLTLARLRQVDCDDSHIFVTLEQVLVGNILDKIAKINSKESSTALIVDCIGEAQKYPESLKTLMKNVKNVKTIALVMSEAECSKLKENFPEVELKTFDHMWVELTKSSKANLLSRNVTFQGVELKLNELIKPTSGAMNFFPLGELLDSKEIKIGSKLHETSHNFYIARKFTEKKSSASLTLTDLLKLMNESRMNAMIISDEAGSGKSVTLFKVAKNLHDAYPDRWVLFVDLKRHIEAFKRIENENYGSFETFEDFIVQQILKNEPKFDQELFKQMFRNGNTFVLFDGFDEISPNNKNLLLHVLSLFQLRSGNQLFITTRPHLEADVVGVLGNFVFKLEHFSKENQKSFLRSHFQTVESEMSLEDFEVLSNQLLEKFSKIAISELIGHPLLIRTTAEIFLSNSFKVDFLCITAVFQKFFAKYLARWTDNENEISRSEIVEFQMGEGVLDVHHTIAINHIFEGQFMGSDFDESDAEKISRVGLVRFDKAEKTFQFIHEKFAEYFVADYICFNLNRKNRDPTHECRKAVEILIEVLVSDEFDCEFEVIQLFLDEILETMKFNPSEAFCKSVAKCISEVVKSRSRFDFLVKNLHASRENLASLVLSIVKHVEKDLLLKMLQSRTNFVRSTALLNIASHGSSTIVSNLCDIITTCTNNQKEIYQVEDQYHGNILQAAARNNKNGVLTALCINLSFMLTKDEINTMFHRKSYRVLNILTEAIYSNLQSQQFTDKTFLELLSLLPNYLSRVEIKILMQAVDEYGRNFFHIAVIQNTSECLKRKLEVVKKYFEAEEQKFFFFMPAAAPNIFHCAARNRNEKIFETLIESTRGVLSSDEIKAMLMQKDSGGSNVLHIIARHGNEIVLNELNLLLRDRLSDDEIRSLLLEVCDGKKNCFRLAANNAELNFEIFCEIFGNLLPIEDRTRLLRESINDINISRLACGNYTNEIVPVETIKDLLARKDGICFNAFQTAAFCHNVDSFNKLFSFAQARFSMDEMKSFLFDCGFLGNCLHYAVVNHSQENIIKAIIETIKAVSSIEEQKKIVHQKNYSQRNVFHHAVIFCKISQWHSLYNGVSTILSKDEIKEMLKDKSEGDNILCANIKSNNNKLSLLPLIKFLKQILTSDEIKDLFSDVDREGKNFFHCAVERSSKFAIKSLSRAIKGIFDRDDQKKIFKVKNPNLFHLAAENLRTEIFSTTHECLKDVLSNDEMKSLIQEKNSGNRNILHLICQHDANNLHDLMLSLARLRDFLKVLKDVCDADELENFLTSSDNNGSNCLLLAVQFKNQPFLRELFSLVRSKISVEDQRSLIQKCDKESKNIFTCAAFNEVPEMLSFVENLVKDILTEVQIEEIKKMHHQYIDAEVDTGTDTEYTSSDSGA